MNYLIQIYSGFTTTIAIMGWIFTDTISGTVTYVMGTGLSNGTGASGNLQFLQQSPYNITDASGNTFYF